MANFINKLLGMFSLTDEFDDDEDEFDDDDFDDDEDDAPKFSVKKKEKARDFAPEPKVEKKNNVLPYSKKTNKSSNMSVCVIRPTTLEEGREISDTLNSGRPVVLNLEDVDGDMAQRIIDFSSGACYSIGGNLQKISTYIFVLTPSSVDIAGDFQDLISTATASSSQMNTSSMMNQNTMMNSNSMMNQNRYRF